MTPPLFKPGLTTPSFQTRLTPLVTVDAFGEAESS